MIESRPHWHDDLSALGGLQRRVKISYVDIQKSWPFAHSRTGCSVVIFRAGETLVHQFQPVLLHNGKANLVPFGNFQRLLEAQALSPELDTRFKLGDKKNGRNLFYFY